MSVRSPDTMKMGSFVPANSLVGHEAPDIRPTRLLAGTVIFKG